MRMRMRLTALVGILHSSGIASAFTAIQKLAISKSAYDAKSRSALPFNNNGAIAPFAAVDTAQVVLSPATLETLAKQGYVIIPNFLSQSLVDELRRDVIMLRGKGDGVFKSAKIGQDATNALNTDIRIAETCFLGRGRKELTSMDSSTGIRNNSIRDRSGGLYDIIDSLRSSLDAVTDSSTASSILTSSTTQAKLDPSLTELLYAYYPKGGYYRRHRDAIPNSASVLRKYSLLLYLNDENYDPIVDAGQLRIHLDGGGDECPEGVLPKYIDVNPNGGTLVLFRSESIPHEVLNTDSERYALVGWFNRGVSVADIGDMASGGAIVRMGLLAVSMAMVTYGVANLVGA